MSKNLIDCKQFTLKNEGVSRFDFSSRSGIVSISKFAGYVYTDLSTHFGFSQTTGKSFDNPFHGKAGRFASIHRTVEDDSVNQCAMIMLKYAVVHGWTWSFAFSYDFIVKSRWILTDGFFFVQKFQEFPALGFVFRSNH